MLIINTILDNFITNKSQNTNVNKVQNTSNLNMLKVSDYYFTLEKNNYKQFQMCCCSELWQIKENF